MVCCVQEEPYSGSPYSWIAKKSLGLATVSYGHRHFKSCVDIQAPPLLQTHLVSVYLSSAALPLGQPATS